VATATELPKMQVPAGISPIAATLSFRIRHYMYASPSAFAGASLDEVPFRGPHGVAIDAADVDHRPQTTLDGVIDADHRLPGGQQPVDDIKQQPSRHGPRIPACPAHAVAAAGRCHRGCRAGPPGFCNSLPRPRHPGRAVYRARAIRSSGVLEFPLPPRAAIRRTPEPGGLHTLSCRLQHSGRAAAPDRAARSRRGALLVALENGPATVRSGVLFCLSMTHSGSSSQRAFSGPPDSRVPFAAGHRKCGKSS
jgi:hypothetical protein